MMRRCACGGSFRWHGSVWLTQGGWPHHWEAAPLFSLFPGFFPIVFLKLCSVWLAFSCWLRMHITKIFLQLAGNFWLHMDVALGSRLLYVPVGVLWICNLVLSAGALSAVVCLGWGVGIFGVNLSHSLVLRCSVFLIFNPISVLFFSIGPLSTLGLPHIWLGVLRWCGPRAFYLYTWSRSCLPIGWNLCTCLGVSRVLVWFLPVHSRMVLGIP